MSTPAKTTKPLPYARWSLKDRESGAFGESISSRTPYIKYAPEQMAMRRVGSFFSALRRQMPDNVERLRLVETHQAMSELEAAWSTASLSPSVQDALIGLAFDLDVFTKKAQLCAEPSEPLTIDQLAPIEQRLLRLATNIATTSAVSFPWFRDSWTAGVSPGWRSSGEDARPLAEIDSRAHVRTSVAQPWIVLAFSATPSIFSTLLNEAGVFRELGRPAQSIFKLIKAMESQNRSNAKGAVQVFENAIEALKLNQPVGIGPNGSLPPFDWVLRQMASQKNQAPDFSHWLELLERIPERPWMQRVYKDPKQDVTRVHPLRALAYTFDGVAWETPSVAERLPKLVKLFLSLGYGANFEFPLTMSALGAERAPCSFVNDQEPNALWAMAKAPGFPQALPEVFSILRADGADPMVTVPTRVAHRKLSMLAVLNEAPVFRFTGKAQQIETVETVFSLLVQWGLDPMNTLPPPQIQDARDGVIRSIVRSRMEQKALIDSLPDADVREGLALLREKRLREAQNTTEPPVEIGSPAPAHSQEASPASEPRAAMVRRRRL